MSTQRHAPNAFTQHELPVVMVCLDFGAILGTVLGVQRKIPKPCQESKLGLICY
jgi:hypothetical protein